VQFSKRPFLRVIPICILLLVSECRKEAFAQLTLSGTIVSSRDSLPIPYAIVSVPASDLWSTANEKGVFRLNGALQGTVKLSVRYLGFVTQELEVNTEADQSDLIVYLQENNLTLSEVSVTGRKDDRNLSTSFVMDRTSLDHMQMLSVADAVSLLPGGKTNTSQHLAGSASQTIAVTGTSGEMGNAVFGVGVEVDGIRLSNNGSAAIQGADIRNIASSNVQSVEVISGIPSVEYGDATNGIVRINTRKGRSKFIIDLVTKPNTKQFALSKGFDLKRDRGVLNFNAEHTRSISDLASPYTTYTRDGLSLNYSNTFGKQRQRPLELNIGATGNVGGFNDRSDPDRFVNTYSKMKDNVIRGNVSAKWLINKPWITNLDFTATANYNDRLAEKQTNKSSSSSVAAIHATKEGYYIGQRYETNPGAEIILIDPGYWYERSYNDNKLLNYSSKLKGTLSKRFNDIYTRLLLGAEYTASGNLGRGNYYDDPRFAPTWREFRYDQLPFTNNYAGFVEENVFIPGPRRSGLEVVGGMRWDATAIKGSVYGLASNFSPRLNAEYTFWKKAPLAVEDLSLKVGWGRTVKLPSYSTLFPTVNYREFLTFAPGTTADGTTYYAYYNVPSKQQYNPDLKWQSNNQFEIGLNMKVRGTKILVTASKDITHRAYESSVTYTPFTYKFTDQSNLENSQISITDRIYAVDQSSGIVTVKDRTGKKPSDSLAYRSFTRFISNAMAINTTPIQRRRLQWIVDFKRIPAIRTQFRVDGNWYYYKGVDQTVTAYMPNSTINMADGNPYKYIGMFVGGASTSNGSMSKTLNMNLTATTHIPAIRLIVSTRIEASLQNYSQSLSENMQGNRGFVLDGRDEYTPSETKKDIYAGNQFVGVYPEYYVSLDDMSTPVPFAEKFLWAKENDKVLYNELAKMVIRTNYNYLFNPNRVSKYFSANIGVTKEIGQIATISFNATNFISNMGTIRSSGSNATTSLFGSSRIPTFYYGLSLRLKL
jgi:hypothetical protein